jgi:hypothetical protein
MNTLSEESKKQFATLFNEYSPTNKWASLGTAVFLLRRFLSILIIVIFYNYPFVQLGGIFVINAAVRDLQ